LLAFPGYTQNDWVRLQNHAGARWQDLVDLWCAYNIHLAHIVRQIPSPALRTTCRVGAEAPTTLGALVEGYVRHVEHHLEQLGIRTAEDS
jgi:hypothetical protein